jgi:hypothetical protein
LIARHYVKVTLAGTNAQIDFNNIGFSGELSAIPEPNSVLCGLFAFVAPAFRRQRSKGT